MTGLGLDRRQDYDGEGDTRRMPGRGNVQRPDRKFHRVLRKDQVEEAAILTEQGNRNGRQLVSSAR